MAKTEQPTEIPLAPEPPAPAEVVGSFPISLDEACRRLSLQGHGPEALGAFHAVEKAANHLQDLEPAYKARLKTFLAQPA